MVPVLVLCDLAGRWRARPHQAHLTHKNIPELRQLIEAGLAQKTANGSNPRIILDLEDRTAHLVLAHQLLLALFRVDVHGTELPTLETPAAHPHPLLAKEDWPWIVDLDGHRNKWQKKAKNAQANQRADNIEGSFEKELPGIEGFGVKGQNRDGVVKESSRRVL